MKKALSNNESFMNFLWNVLISASVFKDYFYQASDEIITKADKLILLKNHLGSLHVWKKLYKHYQNNLLNNVLLTSPGDFQKPTKVEFHPRFGWIVSAGSLRAFLGKVSLLDNTSVRIGKRTYFSGQGIIRGGNCLEIGSFSAIAEGFYVVAGGDRHPFEYASQFGFKTERRLKSDGINIPVIHKFLEQDNFDVSIGSDVWICRNCRLMNGVKIGNGCLIAEGALVNKHCEDYGVYGGTPAKLIRYRFPKNVIEQLLELRWWNWDMSKICINTTFFDTDLRNFNGNLKSLIK